MGRCPVYVMTIDQRRSRTDRDRVPDALTELSDVHTVRPFDRTAGDEIQAVLDDPATVAEVIIRLLTDGRWSVGVGVGPVDMPLPHPTRAGRGRAFEVAREAVDVAKKRAVPVAITGFDESATLAERADIAGQLLGDIIVNRSDAGAEAVRAMSGAASQSAAAQALSISPQAISQRLRAARWELGVRARELLIALLADADTAALTATDSDRK